jgi:hypothetical protein
MRINGRALQLALGNTMQPSFLTPAFAQCLGWQRYDPPAALPQLLKVNGLEFYCIGSGGGTFSGQISN